jgi:hypothetical protein
MRCERRVLLILILAVAVPSLFGAQADFEFEEREKRWAKLAETAFQLRQSILNRDVESFLKLTHPIEIVVSADIAISRADLKAQLRSRRGSTIAAFLTAPASSSSNG